MTVNMNSPETGQFVPGMPNPNSGRNPKDLNEKQWEQLEQYVMSQCSLLECASAFRMSINTLQRIVRERTVELSEDGNGLSWKQFHTLIAPSGRAALKAKLMSMALKGQPLIAVALMNRYNLTFDGSDTDSQEIKRLVIRVIEPDGTVKEGAAANEYDPKLLDPPSDG
jgi:hypothetical protein